MKNDSCTSRSALLLALLLLIVIQSLSLPAQVPDSTRSATADTVIHAQAEGGPQVPAAEATRGGLAEASGGTVEAQAARSLEEAEWRFFRASKWISAILVLVLGWFVLRYTGLVLNVLSERWPRYRLTIKGIIPVVRILGWTALISFVVIGIFRPPIQSVLAFTASAGIAIGFASQDVLKNIFGGIVILFDKPFGVGDKIQIDQHYGEVLSIGLRTVRLLTPDDSVVAVPNMEIVSKSVSNANAGAPDCQVAIYFHLPVDADMDRARELALRCAALSRYAYLNKPRAVVFTNEERNGHGMIRLKLKVYVLDHRFEFALVSDLTRTVIREFRKAGLQLLDQPLPAGDVAQAGGPLPS